LSALIFLHGNGEDLHLFDSHINFFSTSYFVVGIDSRGQGKSTGIPNDYRDLMIDVINVMNKLELEKAHVLGYSDGGILCLLLAIEYPTRLLSFIAVSPNCSPDVILAKYRFILWRHYYYLSIKACFSRGARKEKKIWSLMLYHPHITEKQLQSIKKIPTLILRAENDMFKPGHVEMIHKCIEGSEVKTLFFNI
jgi:pimeloyl-ACP methyl ester carboxylesterase